MNSPFEIPIEVSNITRTLKKANFEAYLVGGCVRDLFLGKRPKDWDVTTNASPEKIIELFQKTFYENAYGTVGIVNEDTEDATVKVIEVTPYRTEGPYTDNRRPDFISFKATLEDDLKRRDFTINAIALDIEGNEVVDPFDGRRDLQAGTIKTVGGANDRFREDALRILRAVRIYAELGFVIEERTEKAMVENVHLLSNIAKERIRDEFTRIVMSPNPMQGMLALQKYGIIDYISPVFRETFDVKQNKAHAYDVWTHLLKALQHTADRNWPIHIRLAALFHDISKPAAKHSPAKGGEPTFYNHEVIGEQVTRETLKSLKFPGDLIEKVAKLVRWHMFFSDTEQITHSAVRRLISNVGKENVWDLMDLRAADRIGTGRPKENPYRLRKYKAMVEEVISDPVSLGMLAIDGQNIIETTGLEPGPKIGLILHAIFEEVLENPILNTKENLEKRAFELAKLPHEELIKIGERGKERKETEEKLKVRKIRSKYKVD